MAVEMAVEMVAMKVASMDLKMGVRWVLVEVVLMAAEMGAGMAAVWVASKDIQWAEKSVAWMAELMAV
jgi:hypothetical protein